MKFNLPLGLALVAAMALSLLAGKVWIPPSAFSSTDPRWLIIIELRLPRTILAALVGAGLGVSGAAMQGYLRNPLADPGLFGVSSSAALGAVASMFFGVGLLAPAALGGAALGMAAIALLVARSASVLVFTLAGVILSSLTGSLTALLISLAPTPFAQGEIVTWLMGALTDRSWDDVRVALAPMVVGTVLLAFTARALDALTLGEQVARSLGIDMSRLQWIVIGGVGLVVGAGVASAGVIGFVGLIVPHLIRPFVGARPSALLIPSALAGALLIIVADTIVRVMPTAGELRLGIAMSLLGTPFFLVLLARLRRTVS